MDSLYNFYKRKSSVYSPTNGKPFLTNGDKIKLESNTVMEKTWWNDPQSKHCYIYDFFHDDQPDKCLHMTYDNTTKTPIDAKFIVTQYSSVSKDQVEYHLLFKPSQKTEFDDGDELYYYQKDYVQRYSTTFPIGLYIDIPNEKGIYEKWLICGKEYGNQFIKYAILPCDYYFQWIEDTGTKRIKRQMWCVSRAMNNYTSGRWTDSKFTSPDDIQKVWLPANKITEKIRYANGRKDNQRVLLGLLVEHPLAWQVSKVEPTKPLGIIKITLDQDVFNEHTDYVNLKTGEMFADYYSQTIEPTLPPDNVSLPDSDIAVINTSTNTIKNGGSYKLLTVIVTDKDGNDVTENYKDFGFVWTCSINEDDYTNNDYVTWLSQKDFNKMKIKLANDRSHLKKILNIKCKLNDELSCNTQLEIIV